MAESCPPPAGSGREQEGGSASGESEGERAEVGREWGEEGGRGGRDEEEEEENARLWGPLKGPVQVKIADLGNACWVVRAFSDSLNSIVM